MRSQPHLDLSRATLLVPFLKGGNTKNLEIGGLHRGLELDSMRPGRWVVGSAEGFERIVAPQPPPVLSPGTSRLLMCPLQIWSLWWGWGVCALFLYSLLPLSALLCRLFFSVCLTGSTYQTLSCSCLVTELSMFK